MKYKVYYANGMTIIVEGLGKVGEEILYHNVIGFKRVY